MMTDQAIRDLAFCKWYYEIEGYGLRAERFYESVESAPTVENMIEWLRAAFESGYEWGKQENQ